MRMRARRLGCSRTRRPCSGDHRFESAFLQRGICELSVPCGASNFRFGSPATRRPLAWSRAGDAEDSGAVVAAQPAREADQDRRKGRQPRTLRHVPDGRGRGAATDVRRHPVADRPAAGAACAGMTGAEVRCGHGAMVEVRLDTTKALRFGTAVRPTGGYDALPDTQYAICGCSRRPKDRSFHHNVPESGECSLIASLYALCSVTTKILAID